jgi:hypothetical protein
MSDIKFRDQGLRRTFAGMMNDNQITKAEVDKLIESTKDGPGLSKTERKDLQKLLTKAGDRFDADAKQSLESYLGGAAGPTDAEAVRLVSQKAASITDANQIVNGFKSEYQDRRSDFQDPQKAFTLFAEYGGRLKALGANLDPRELDDLADQLLEAGKQTAARGFDKKDTDFDTVSDLAEAAKGRSAAKFDARDEEVGKVWTTTYWPMAGSGQGTDPTGTPGSNLWAKKGPLAKLDELLRARGMENQAKALEFERKPALNWLIGEADKGHMILNSSLSEKDAEMSTGVDFDGDGKLTKGVKVDFLGNDGGFASMSSRNQLVPKATIDGEVVTVNRERIDNPNGEIQFKFTRADNDAELSAEELKSMFYANPASGDGKATGKLDVGWWGSCDKVALAGVLFKEPLKDKIEMNGVTFTKQDMLGLLTVIANSQAKGTDFVGERFDDRPDILVTKDGTQMRGKFEGLKDSTLRGGDDMWRWQGDFMVLSDPFKSDPDREFKFREMDGTEHTVKASDIKHMGREDRQDMPPAEFHTTILSWLSEGRAAAMDRDSGDHVWNYNFHGATLKSATPLKGNERPEDPGHNGNVGKDTKVVSYEMDVRFGESNHPREYRYWLEFDDAGKVVNSGWKSDNPDFLWRPAAFNDWAGKNDRNPFVKPELVKEIYDKFMETN